MHFNGLCVFKEWYMHFNGLCGYVEWVLTPSFLWSGVYVPMTSAVAAEGKSPVFFI